MSTEMDQMCADATAGARAWNEGGASVGASGGGFMPSRSEIAADRLSADLAGELRERHGRANCYRMAEAIAAEERSLEEFEKAYGSLPQVDATSSHSQLDDALSTYSRLGGALSSYRSALDEFLAAVRVKVDELGGPAYVNEQVGGDVIAQLLAIADEGGDDADDGAGAGRSARAEEPRRAFGEER